VTVEGPCIEEKASWRTGVWVSMGTGRSLGVGRGVLSSLPAAPGPYAHTSFVTFV
jgi:hypothetical protein